MNGCFLPVRSQTCIPSDGNNLLHLVNRYMDLYLAHPESITYKAKVERYHIDCVSCAITLIPSREDSFERLEDSNHQFASDEISVEDAAIQAVLIEKMLSCLEMLTPKEQELIKELFFKGKSEHQISREINIAQRTIHDRKVRILGKLKKLMEN